MRTFMYDGHGRLSHVRSGNDATTFAYDTRGRRVSEEDSVRSRRYEWDTFGLLTKVVVDDAAVHCDVGIQMSPFGMPEQIGGTSLQWDYSAAVPRPLRDGDADVLKVLLLNARASSSRRNWIAPQSSCRSACCQRFVISKARSAKLPKTGDSKMSLAPESSRPPRPSSRDSSAVNPASAGRPAPATAGSAAAAIAAGWDLRSTAAGSEQTAGADTAETARHGRSGSCVESGR